MERETGVWAPTPLDWPSEPTASGFAPDGRRLALVDGTSLATLDIAANTVRERLLPNSLVAWSPDGSVLAVLEPGVAPGRAAVRAWDPWSDAPPTTIATVRFDEAALSPANARATGPCLQWLPEVQP